MAHPKKTQLADCSTAFFDAIRPERRLKVSEWSDKYRILQSKASAEPGKWSTERTPYLREIMDELSPTSSTDKVVFMKGAQIGATECGYNFVGFVVHHAPGPMLIVMPTLSTATRNSKQRIAPMINDMPVLQDKFSKAKSRDSANTLLQKDFENGTLILSGSNSAASLRSMPIRFLILDEVDGMEADVGDEGDPVNLAIRRTNTFRRNRKIYILSTPAIKGKSRIEREFLDTDRRYYHVHCLDCGHAQEITWGRLKYKKDAPETVYFECVNCSYKMYNHDKTTLLGNGKWVPTAKNTNPKVRGYHLSGLYSPDGWYSWEDAVRDYEKSKHDSSLLKEWTNTVLGQTWEINAENVDDEELFARRETYLSEVPEGVAVLTAGVDIQKHGIHVVVMGWGDGEESWCIDHQVFQGSPSETGVWDTLATYLQREWQHQLGLKLRIVGAAIDSGGHFTQQVYHFCKLNYSFGWYAVKGQGTLGSALISRPTRNNKYKVPLFKIGVDTGKNILYARLRIEDHGPGYCHFSMSRDEEFFAELTSEEIRTKRVRGYKKEYWYLPKGRRNEVLDCTNYALAALHIRIKDMEQLKYILDDIRKAVGLYPLFSSPQPSRSGMRVLDTGVKL